MAKVRVSPVLSDEVQQAIAVIVGLAKGKDAKDCKLRRQMIAFAFTGKRRGFWTSIEEFKAAAGNDRRFKSVLNPDGSLKAVDWDAFFNALVQAMILFMASK